MSSTNVRPCSDSSVFRHKTTRWTSADDADAAEEFDEGDGVLIMTDILGATPSNLALKLLEPGRIESVAGVSLPMILRALTYRKNGMETLLQKLSAVVATASSSRVTIPAFGFHTFNHRFIIIRSLIFFE